MGQYSSGGPHFTKKGKHKLPRVVFVLWSPEDDRGEAMPIASFTDKGEAKRFGQKLSKSHGGLKGYSVRRLVRKTDRLRAHTRRSKRRAKGSIPLKAKKR